MVQWVRNLTSVAQVIDGVWVQSPAQQSGLKLRCRNCDLDLIPGPGTSICRGCGHKKINKEANSPTHGLSEMELGIEVFVLYEQRT